MDLINKKNNTLNDIIEADDIQSLANFIEENDISIIDYSNNLPNIILDCITRDKLKILNFLLNHDINPIKNIVPMSTILYIFDNNKLNALKLFKKNNDFIKKCFEEYEDKHNMSDEMINYLIGYINEYKYLNNIEYEIDYKLLNFLFKYNKHKLIVYEKFMDYLNKVFQHVLNTGDEKIAQLLFDNGFNISDFDKALLIRCKYPNVISIFLPHLLTIIHKHNTVLHYAILNNHVQLCDKILQTNIDHTYKNLMKHTAEELAIELGNRAIYELFLKYNKQSYDFSCLYIALNNKNFELLSYLFDVYQILNQKPLIYATETYIEYYTELFNDYCNIKPCKLVIEYLINKGIKITIPSENIKN